jgi:ATP-dependent Clp protease ATP-binding subunit ClpA
MYPRFTDRARKVMKLANDEAIALGQDFVDTEHILLGLIKEESGVAANVLKNLDLNLEKIRIEVERLVPRGPDRVMQGTLPHSATAKKAIDAALKLARRLDHNYVGTEHLLLGLVHEQQGGAVQVLMNLGLKREEIRQEVLDLLGHGIDVAEGGARGDKERRGTIPPIPISHDTKTGGRMYAKFTDRARKVMQLANQEAQRFNHEYIGTEHVLLGLLREGHGVAANALRNLDIDLRKIRLEVEKIIQSGPDMVTMGKLPQTPRAKKVVEFAMEEARSLNHNYVGTEHILLGLLREQEGIAAQVLMNLGLKLEEVREEVLNLLRQGIESTWKDRGVLPRPQMQAETLSATSALWLQDGPSAAQQRPTGPPAGAQSDKASAFEVKTAVVVLCVISLAAGIYFLATGDRDLMTPGAILVGSGIIALALGRR